MEWVEQQARKEADIRAMLRKAAYFRNDSRTMDGVHEANRALDNLSKDAEALGMSKDEIQKCIGPDHW